MKASEYAERFIVTRTARGFPAAAKELLDGLMRELIMLSDFRHAKSNEAGMALLNEFDKKFEKIAELTGPGLRSDGFRRLIELQFPDMYQLWMESRKIVPSRSGRPN